jgi:tetratricopeptide (TPR) repeat protein
LGKAFGGLDVISGLAGGVTLALFVGRVQSKFLGPSTWLPIALYFYVALQSLYIAIAQTRTSGALIIECALILKCLLFLYITWLFKSGRFLFYFVRVKTIYEGANPHWKTFFLNLDRTLPEGSMPITDHHRRATAKSGDVGVAKSNPAQEDSSANAFPIQIRRHWRYAVIAAVIIGASILTYTFFKIMRSAPLTEADTILIADFDDETGHPDLDITMKKGLAAQLEQSPFLHVFPQQRVKETLQRIGQKDARVTSDNAREICQLNRLKAWIGGSITSVGSHYAITLEAFSAPTGEEIAHIQIEAENMEQVLRGLSQAATTLREKLGESLTSIKRFDAPLDLTTSSVDAWKFYSLGDKENIAGHREVAIPLFQKAVDADRNFPYAYLSLAVAYHNKGEPGRAAENAQRAYALLDRASEIEKLRIKSFYYTFVTGEVTEDLKQLEIWKQTYQRDPRVYNNLSDRYATIGDFDRAAEAAGRAIELDPSRAPGYENLAIALIALGRSHEAKTVIEQAFKLKIESTVLHLLGYQIAILESDESSQKQQMDWASEKRERPDGLNWQSSTDALVGKWRLSEQSSMEAIEVATQNDEKELGAQYAAEQALRVAVIFGPYSPPSLSLCSSKASKALELANNSVSLPRSALALALCGKRGLRTL